MTRRIPDRVQALRRQRRWTMETLAERIGATVSTINRIEKGETRLLSDWVPPLADAFGVHWHDLFDDDSGRGRVAAAVSMRLAEDAAPYTVAAGDPLSGLGLAQNRDLWLVNTAVLDAIGIPAGAHIVVDISQHAVNNVMMGDAVVVQHIDPDNVLKATTLLREFVEPDLFITNSRTENAIPLNRRQSDVRIKGVVVHVIASRRAVRAP